MNASGPLAEVSEAVGLAWRVHELGWVRDHASSKRFVEFGTDIQNLAQSLNNIVRVVEYARLLYQQHAVRSPHFRGFSFQKDWDLSSLYEIVGRFKITLDECEAFLIQNSEVYRNQNSIYNNEWTQVLQPKVDDLQKRVRSHNAKITILLKPLEIKLLGSIRSEFGTRSPHDSFNQLPGLPIQGLLIMDIDQALAEQARQEPIPIPIPSELENKIRLAAEQVRPELRLPGGLPLQPGVETFLSFWDQSTKNFTPGSFLNERTPSAKQYLNLLNCILVLRHLQDSYELKGQVPFSLWPNFVAELAALLLRECHRFTPSSQQPLVAPDLASLNHELDMGEHSNWNKREISTLMSPHVSTQMEEVYSVSLPSPQESLFRNLSVSRIDSNRLRLVESIANRDSPANKLGEITMDIDVKSVHLTPIYATPSSRPRPLEFLLHSGTQQLNPSFLEPKHVLRLQHLLTGYKVYDRYDQAMVKVSFFIAGQSTPLEEHGRIQLWLPQPFQPVNRAAGFAPGPADSSGNTPQGGQPPVPRVPSVHAPAAAVNVPTRSVHVRPQAPAPVTPPTMNATPEADTPNSRTSRSGSIRKWIPGMRKGSGASRTLSNASSKTNVSVSGSSNYSNSPPQSPYVADARTTQSNFPPIMEEVRKEYVPTSPPMQSGPFELPAADVPPYSYSEKHPGDGLYPVNPTPHLATTGLIPVSPPNIQALPADANWPLAAPPAQGYQYMSYSGLSPTSPSGLISPGTYNGHSPNSHSPNSPNQPLFRPIIDGNVEPSPHGSHTSLPQAPSQQLPYHPPANPQAAGQCSSQQVLKQLPHQQAPGNGYSKSLYTTAAPSTQYNATIVPKKSKVSPSIQSNMTTRSHSSLAPTVSTIKTSAMGNGIARLHKKPQKPMLVLFLKARDASAKLSIVAIQIDSQTSVMRQRCECYSSHSNCRISCVEREKGGSLLAQRWEADAGLGSWNLAKIGEHQRKEGENVWPNLRRVSMKFEKMEDRYKFAGSPCSCNVKTTHELSRCNLDSHNGLFGIVKQIGTQMLANYHGEKEGAKGKTMVLGTLAEGIS